MAENFQIPNKSVPTVELVHPKAGRVVVNERDADEYIAKGYMPVGGTAAPEQDEEAQDDSKKIVDYTKMNLDELRVAAAKAGVKDPHRLSKAKLLEALGVTAEDDGN